MTNLGYKTLDKVTKEEIKLSFENKAPMFLLQSKENNRITFSIRSNIFDNPKASPQERANEILIEYEGFIILYHEDDKKLNLVFKKWHSANKEYNHRTEKYDWVGSKKECILDYLT